MSMAFLVYLLCALTSLACAVLLLRGYRRTRASLLMWSGLCFVGLAANNALLLVQQHVGQDLSVVRSLPALAGISLLLYGLIWDSDR